MFWLLKEKARQQSLSFIQRTSKNIVIVFDNIGQLFNMGQIGRLHRSDKFSADPSFNKNVAPNEPRSQ
jgi:hypothetical protein